SVLPLDDELEAALLSPVGPHAWPRGRATAALELRPLPAEMHQASFAASSDPHREAAFDAVCGALIAGEAHLDALDAKIGDGDTGTTLANAARSLLAQKHALPFANLGALFGALSQHLSAAMGGSSGVLLGIFTAAVSAAMKSEASLSPALTSGAARVQEYGGAREGDRTMLDALVPAVAVLSSGGTVAEAAVAARDGAERTAALEVARAGRSGYLRSETLRGVSDPGAVAVALVFEALAHRADT
ncbi:MAG: DAK2 domain-containing protein, partial [Polyangiaceae bacterium]|nr:DAK2 domain-containing protein [Polyangiaceae bacterium]